MPSSSMGRHFMVMKWLVADQTSDDPIAAVEPKTSEVDVRPERMAESQASIVETSAFPARLQL